MASAATGPQGLATRTHRKYTRRTADVRSRALKTSVSQQTPLVQPQIDRQPQTDYTAIDGQMPNQLVMGLFRRKMVHAIGMDVPSSGYDAIIDLTRKLNSMGGPRVTQMRTVDILISLFPSWLPGAFKVMFAQTIPGLSCQLNAWATALTCQWLMGKCEVNDVEIDGGKMGVAHGVKVERCRYLEQAGCAAVCMNSCKVPTQEFFANHMGLPLTMTPNYSDFSCQFAFGKTPGPQSTDEAFASPCFGQCPSAKAVKGQQLVVAGQEKPGSPPPPANPNSCSSRCHRVLPMDLV